MFELAANGSKDVCEMFEGCKRTPVPVTARIALSQSSYGVYSAKTFMELRMHATRALPRSRLRDAVGHEKPAA